MNLACMRSAVVGSTRPLQWLLTPAQIDAVHMQPFVNHHEAR